MKNEIISRIDAYIAGTKIYMAKTENEGRKSILQQGIIKLTELKDVVNGVNIAVGDEANGFAKTIVKELGIWSSDVSSAMFDEASLCNLDSAIKGAGGWAKIQKAPRRATADIDAVKFNADDSTDGLIAVVSVSRIDGRAGIFRENLSNYKKKIEKRYDTEEDERELQNKKDERDKINAEIALVRSRYQNGEISKNEALDLLEPLDSEKQFLEDDIYNLTDDIRDAKESASMYKAHLRLLDRIMKVVDTYEGDYVKLSMVYDVIDFNALNAVMMGTADEEDINTVNLFSEIENIITDVEREAIRYTQDKLRETQDKHRSDRQAARHADRERRRGAETNDRLLGLLGEEPDAQQNENQDRARVREDRARLSSILDEN